MQFVYNRPVVNKQCKVAVLRKRRHLRAVAAHGQDVANKHPLAEAVVDVIGIVINEFLRFIRHVVFYYAIAEREIEASFS